MIPFLKIRRRPRLLGCDLIALATGVISVLLLWLGYAALTQGRERVMQTEEALIAERVQQTKVNADSRRSVTELFVQEMYERQVAGEEHTIDFLILSGGGDRGAFGTGFLRSWGAIDDPKFRRPEFESVSGVSTGAFIAPFAFLGTDADFEVADHLFRNPRSDFVAPRGPLFFALGNESFAEILGLEQKLVESVDLAFARRIVQAGGHGRTLMIQATELDEGAAWPFDFVAAARHAVESRDGALFVDGSVMGNIFYGANFKREDSFGAVWKRIHPGHPVPTMRYWVILNTYARSMRKTCERSRTKAGELAQTRNHGIPSRHNARCSVREPRTGD